MTGTRASIVRRFQERSIAPGGVPSEQYVRTEGEEGTTWTSVSDSSEPASEVSSKWAAQLAAEEEAERFDAEADLTPHDTTAVLPNIAQAQALPVANQAGPSSSTPPPAAPRRSPPKRCRPGRERA